MIKRQKILQEVYEHVRKYHGVHTKTEFAVAIHYSRTYISAALNGEEKYLTDRMFRNINEAFPGSFNLEYLLHGVGCLLTPEEEECNDRLMRTMILPPTDTPQQIDTASDIIELYAQRLRLVDDMRTSLREELAEVSRVRADLQQARDDFREATKILNQALSIFHHKSVSYGTMAAEDLEK